ncbi:MAG: ubiquinone/menaquinone biosynthesis protein [Planctomycetaceae bacterium]|nr:ubiquinone/menaquinone biosynthesis protein [Planctomycetaceae bacterium]
MLPSPPVDDRAIYDAFTSRFIFPTLAISVEIGLYELLHREPLRLPEVADELGLDHRAAEAVVAVVAALGFLESGTDGRFSLTPVAQTYLLAESPFFRRELVHFETSTTESLRLAMRAHQEPVDPLAVNIGELPAERVRDFIELMHSMTLAAATGLAEHPVFSGIERLLDVAGGSGSLCLGIAGRHPQLHCTILDLPPVCPIAKGHIDQYDLADRIDVVAANMFQDPWPAGFDGLLFGNIFHDWDMESCRFLARRAFETLQPGGTICLHEMLLDDLKDGPLTVACFSIAMLLHEKGKQFTAGELEDLLGETGFRDFQVTPSYGYYSLVTATRS